MKAIYLDQLHWIALARAKSGAEEDPAIVAALVAAEQAVDRGEVCFPVGAPHFMELSKINDPLRRATLGELYIRLSGLWVFPAMTIMLDPWVERALRLAFDEATPDIPRDTPIRGFINTFPAEFRNQLAEDGPDVLERVGYLSDTAEGWRTYMLFGDEATRRQAVVRMTAAAKQQVSEITERRNIVRTEGPENRRRAYAGLLLHHYRDYYVRAIEKIGVDVDQLTALGWEKAVELVEQVPVLNAELELGLALERQWTRPLEANDTYDVSGLVRATPICTALFTEKQWAALLGQTALSNKYGCSIHCRTGELLEVLHGAA